MVVVGVPTPVFSVGGSWRHVGVGCPLVFDRLREGCFRCGDFRNLGTARGLYCEAWGATCSMAGLIGVGGWAIFFLLGRSWGAGFTIQGVGRRAWWWCCSAPVVRNVL